MTYEELLEKHRQEANQLVNEDKIIYATGSQIFPKGYHEVYKALREIMKPVN